MSGPTRAAGVAQAVLLSVLCAAAHAQPLPPERGPEHAAAAFFPRIEALVDAGGWEE
ncbi:hypothetical protein GI374_17835 [Paracoccus sp. S-4012]|uniref:hypothetical protein n=1 Tax=Paracoccus sp. S-4012 TaxID=2665648 RepID=UPI0012AF9DA5|nr:hypothetical protein [Paracoccus sp. S-4012]MRX52218.1 hypothetical protein [Paracoccus sp. S-4012]